MPKPISHHEALIYVMVTMSAVDRKMTDEELSRIGDIVSNLPIFDDFQEEQLVTYAEACGEILSSEGGLDEVLRLVALGLPKRLHETAYALALEVAAADMDVRPEEVRLLDLLAGALKLDKLITAAIERGIRARLARA
ncbi:MAG: tellurite resistance TerB family protein [Methyloligellaceae bacterium]